MSVNKTELDFSLVLCNAICDQLYLFFIHSYVASKIETKEKNGNDEIRRAFKIIDWW